MKLSAFAAVLAGAGIAQVAAVPIRVILVSTSVQQGPTGALDHVRFGHPVEHNPAVANMRMVAEGAFPTASHRPCRGRLSPLRQKSIEISNAFRQALGLPAIEAHPPHHHLKYSSGPVGVWQSMPNERPGRVDPPHHHLGYSSGPGIAIPNGWPGSVVTHHPHHQGNPRMRQHGVHGDSFMTRVHYSLANLGRWEGRAVAFVLGCGIGVLLRMFSVFAIIMYRAVRGSRQDQDEDEYSHIVIYDADEVVDTPPTYAYPVDEKVALEADAKTPVVEEPVKPATTEEEAK